MELKIVEKKEKILLSRTEIKAEVIFTGAVPSKERVKKELGAKLKADENLIVIKNIFPFFKSNKADVLAYYYINKEDMKKIEQKKKEKKPAEKKKPEALKETPKKEAPKAEKGKEPKKASKEQPKIEEGK